MPPYRYRLTFSLPAMGRMSPRRPQGPAGDEVLPDRDGLFVHRFQAHARHRQVGDVLAEPALAHQFAAGHQQPAVVHATAARQDRRNADRFADFRRPGPAHSSATAGLANPCLPQAMVAQPWSGPARPV